MQDDNDKAEIVDRDALAKAEEMLGCDHLIEFLTSKKMTRGGKGDKRQSVTRDRMRFPTETTICQ